MGDYWIPNASVQWCISTCRSATRWWAVGGLKSLIISLPSLKSRSRTRSLPWGLGRSSLSGTNRLDRSALPQTKQGGWSTSVSIAYQAQDFLQEQWWSPIEPAMVGPCWGFHNLLLWRYRFDQRLKPDETMTLTLLYLLEKNDLDHQIFENVKALNSCVMTMR